MAQNRKCLDLNVLVSFASGTHLPEETEMVEEHLRACKDCRTVVEELRAEMRKDEGEGTEEKES